MDLDLVKKTTEDLLTDLGFTPKVSVFQEGEQVVVDINVGEENAMIIGFHGETLNSLQTILTLVLFKKTQNYVPLTVDVGGYRRERSEKIKQMAVNAADRARFLARSIELSPMNASERRLAHLYVSELTGVKSESVGEGRDRRVVVSPA